ncbi:MAG: hypothetical protein ACLTXT_05095 [Ruminococcus callidus]
MLVVLGLGDLFGTPIWSIEGAFLLMGIAAVAVCRLSAVPVPEEPDDALFQQALLVMTVLELTVFQYPSYHLMLGDYPEKILLPWMPR